MPAASSCASCVREAHPRRSSSTAASAPPRWAGPSSSARWRTLRASASTTAPDTLPARTGSQPRTSEQMARELHTLLANAGEHGPFVLVGHSFGAFTVRVYHAMYPAEVAGVVMVGRLAGGRHRDAEEPSACVSCEDAGGRAAAAAEYGAIHGKDRPAAAHHQAEWNCERLEALPRRHEGAGCGVDVAYAVR